MNKFLCIHGHFYQPPRENAWLEEIEIQDSAYPYHDWNQRINEECYAPNGVSRILDDEMKIVDIVNNYAKISFNIGPTLLSWMEKYAPKAYQHVLEGDLESQKRFNGHGSALAQVYNHIIMPLANRKDKETQVIWGLKDFEYRFKRKAVGMWLAETAVDTETLEVLAENDIQFTVLAPRQAKRFRKIGSTDWQNGILTKKHYVCNLPSGKKITLFFYDGQVSEAVAFKGLLNDGRKFASYLTNAFDNHDSSQQLVHIATDGESYGHHHRYGDMALAFCLQYIEDNNLARLTNYSEFMSLVEAEYEVEIHENSSWSCVHGVERWRSNCGCNTGGRSDWHQRWREPLRNALNWLRDELIRVYETEMAMFNEQAWEIRNHYIDVILDRSRKNVENFIQKHSDKDLNPLDKTQFIRLIEMQRQALLMFTSCAWFFDEVSGIETVQVLQYANRAIQLAEASNDKYRLEEKFLFLLSLAPSNLSQYGTTNEIYKRQVSPSRLSLTKVGMHYAVASLFAESPESVNLQILNYECVSSHFERREAGLQKLAIGRTTVKSNITLSEKYFSFAVVYLGQHHIIGFSSNEMTSTDYFAMTNKLKEAFMFSNIADVLQLMQVYFKSKNFSIWELFRDERIKVLNQILQVGIVSVEESYQKIFNGNYNIINAMRSVGLKIPPILKQNLDVVVNTDLENFFSKRSTNTKRLKDLCEEVEKWQVPLDTQKIAFVASQSISELVERWAIGLIVRTPDSSHAHQTINSVERQTYKDNEKVDMLVKINEMIQLLQKMKITLQLNETQNTLFKISKRLIPAWNGVEDEKLDVFVKLCANVNMKLNLKVKQKV